MYAHSCVQKECQNEYMLPYFHTNAYINQHIYINSNTIYLLSVHTIFVQRMKIVILFDTARETLPAFAQVRQFLSTVAPFS